MTKQLAKTQNSMLKNSTEVSQFRASANQRLWLEKSMEIDGGTIKEIAEACELDRTNWYNWLKESGFIEWYNAEWDRRLKSYSQRLDMIGLQNARKDFNYWKEMQKRVGNISEDKNMIAVQSNIVFTRGEESNE